MTLACVSVRLSACESERSEQVCVKFSACPTWLVCECVCAFVFVRELERLYERDCD